MQAKELLRDTKGGLDEALGLVFQVFVFMTIAIFGASLLGSAVSQGMAQMVAKHITNQEALGVPIATVLNEAQTQTNQFLMTSNTSASGVTDIQYQSAVNQCQTSSSAACVVIQECSLAQLNCKAEVQRRVYIPILDMHVTWTAQATSLFQPSVGQLP